MGKTIPIPYPGQSMEDYRKVLVNFRNNYWKLSKSSKSGGRLIPYPPSHLKPK